MTAFAGRLEVPGVVDHPIGVQVDLDAETISLSAEGNHIGSWELDSIRVLGQDMGFELCINGARGTLRTEDDGEFAIEIGLQWAPPRLRRLMLAKLARREAELGTPMGLTV